MIWDIVQPKDEWEHQYCKLEYLRIGLIKLRGTPIKVNYIDGSALDKAIAYIEGFKP